MIIMGKMKEKFMKQNPHGSITDMGDEDYLYEQYLLQEKLNEQYWEEVSKKSIFPDGIEYDDEYYKSAYFPTPEEEVENFKQTIQQNEN
jgi:hypothetical protein